MDYALEVKGLSKTYKKIRIYPGQCFLYSA